MSLMWWFPDVGDNKCQTLEAYLIGNVNMFWIFRIIFIIDSWSIGKCWGLDLLVRSPRRLSMGTTHESFWVVTFSYLSDVRLQDRRPNGKSKNHTAHNQSYKAHRTGIKKPKTYRHSSTKGVCKREPNYYLQTLLLMIFFYWYQSFLPHWLLATLAPVTL